MVIDYITLLVDNNYTIFTYVIFKLKPNTHNNKNINKN